MLAAAGALVLAAVELPELFGWRSYAVLSGSMAPAVPVGAAVVTRPVAPAQLRVGDVISFSVASAPGVTITHRVVGIDRPPGDSLPRVRTRGDANDTEDPFPPDLRLPVSRVVYWVPLAGYAMIYASQPAVRALTVAAGLAVIWGSGWRSRGEAAAAH